MKVAALYFYDATCEPCVGQGRKLAEAASAYDTSKVAFQALTPADESYSLVKPYLSGASLPVLVLYNYDAATIEKGLLKVVPDANFVTPTTLRDYLEEIGIERRYRIIADVIFDNFEGWQRRPVRAVYVIGSVLLLGLAGYLVWRFRRVLFTKKK